MGKDRQLRGHQIIGSCGQCDYTHGPVYENKYIMFDQRNDHVPTT